MLETARNASKSEVFNLEYSGIVLMRRVRFEFWVTFGTRNNKIDWITRSVSFFESAFHRPDIFGRASTRRLIRRNWLEWFVRSIGTVTAECSV